MRTLFIAVMILGCAGALSAQKVNPNQIQPGANGTCLYTNGSGVVVWQSVCGTVTLQTNGTNNTSQALLNFVNTNGVTWSNPSGGVEEVNVNVQALGGPPIYQSYCHGATSTPTSTCNLPSVAQGDYLTVLAADDCYGISGTPPTPVITDNRSNTWFTDATQQNLYLNGQGSEFLLGHAYAGASGSVTIQTTQTGLAGCASRILVVDYHAVGVDTVGLASGAIDVFSLAPTATATQANDAAVVLSLTPLAGTTVSPGSSLFSDTSTCCAYGWQFSAVGAGSPSTATVTLSGGSNFPVAAMVLLKTNLQYNTGQGSINPTSVANAVPMYAGSNSNSILYPSGLVTDAGGDLNIPGFTSGPYSSVASAGSLTAPSRIFHIADGTHTINTITPASGSCQGSSYNQSCWLIVIPDAAVSFAPAGLAQQFDVGFTATVPAGQPLLLVYKNSGFNNTFWEPIFPITAENTVAFSATPTFSATAQLNTITLTGNVTSSTLAAGSPGFRTTFLICQDSSGSHTFVWPANVRGGMTVGSTASKCSAQEFTYSGTATAWLADSAGVTNQ